MIVSIRAVDCIVLDASSKSLAIAVDVLRLRDIRFMGPVRLRSAARVGAWFTAASVQKYLASCLHSIPAIRSMVIRPTARELSSVSDGTSNKCAMIKETVRQSC